MTSSRHLFTVPSYEIPNSGKTKSFLGGSAPLCERQASPSQSQAERCHGIEKSLSASGRCVCGASCWSYLYLGLHANGSCETSKTFFPTVTFYQSVRGTRGRRGGWLVVAALPLVVWSLSGRPMAGAGFKARPGLPSIIQFTY